MSEFQYYEFVAIDRPLGLNERKRLRVIWVAPPKSGEIPTRRPWSREIV